MPSIPFRVTSIESLMPSMDERDTDSQVVIDGRNFFFDSKGPKSGFSTRILTPFPFADPAHIQGITVTEIERTFVFTNDAILVWRTTVPFMWEVLYTFDSPVPTLEQLPWSAIYVEGDLYLAHPYRGLFEATVVDGTQKLWLSRKTSADIPGLPVRISAMMVVRGRPVLIGDDSVVWGSVGDLADLTPALGGAGLQLIDQYLRGDFLALTNLVDGFVVWLTSGSLLVEFIDGDDVWRFTAQPSSERPINLHCMITLSTGADVFLSRHGLMTSGNGKSPEPWTPEFNEFFIDYIKQSTLDYRHWHVDYYEAREMIFVSESMNRDEFWRTFVLTPTRNKWGVFSVTHHGFLSLTNNEFGYVDKDGVPHYFYDSFTREVMPDNARGLNRHYPRLEKQLHTPSSSAVSNAVEFNAEAPTDAFTIPAVGWYAGPSTTPAAYSAGGMDSWIEIGYFRPPEVAQKADGIIEIQELIIGSTNSAPPTELNGEYQTAHKPEMYAESEDWNSEAIITPGNFTEDLNTSDEDNVDLNNSSNTSNLDLQELSYPTVSFSNGGFEDWDSSSAAAEDWGGPYSALTQLSHTLSLQGSTDGITFDEYVPELTRFDIGARTYAVLTSGRLHRLRLEATDPYEYYHLMSVAMSLNYIGELQ